MVIQSLTWLLYEKKIIHVKDWFTKIPWKRHLNSKHFKQYSLHMSGLFTFTYVLPTYVYDEKKYIFTSNIFYRNWHWWCRYCILFILFIYYSLLLFHWTGSMRYEVWDRFKLFLYKIFNLVILGVVPKEHVLKTRKAVYI
jgi:hypothetical protein